MATENSLKLVTFEAGADLSAKQYYFVKLSAANTVDVCSGATDIPIGILQNDPTSGQEAVVALLGGGGISKVSSNEALTVGWMVGTSSDGQADRKIPGTDTTEYMCGQVITATTAAAGFAEVALEAPRKAT